MTKDRVPYKRGSGSDGKECSPAAGQRWGDRRAGGRHIGAFIPALTQPAFRRKSPLLVRLMMDWEDFVGPRLAKETEPRRLSAGSLTLACSGPVAMELQYAAPHILERINATCGLLGENRILHLKIVQDRTVPVPTVRARPRVVKPEITDIDNDELRDALERLGGQIAARSRR